MKAEWLLFGLVVLAGCKPDPPDAPQHQHQDHAGHEPETQQPDRGMVMATPEKFQRSGIRLGTVTRKPVKETIRAVGRVDYNERLLSAVTLKFPGWVERLIVNATGDSVRKGTPLLDIYSPDLLEAQRSYLIALAAAKVPSAQGNGFADQSLKSARERLLLWDLTEEQIRDLENRKEAQSRSTLLSKVEGIVIKRNVTLGDYVQAGTELYQIADLATVWVRADIYEYEIPQVSVGMEARIALTSVPGEPVGAKVDFIYPYLNEQTRTVGVRLVALNPHTRMKPGMYANVSIDIDLGSRLVVNEEAVIYTGTRNIVYVATQEDMLDPRDVDLGPHVGNEFVVRSGLTEGERIVVSGTFLVDSESRLKASGGGMEMHQH